MVLFGWLWTSGCDSDEVIAGFTPIEVPVARGQQMRLGIINHGREPHEFKSLLLAHQVRRQTGSSSSLAVLPNQKVEGCHPGHAGMSGTIIVR